MHGLLIILPALLLSLLLAGVLLAISRRTTQPAAGSEPTQSIDLTVRDPWARATPVRVRQAAHSGQYQVSRDVLPGR